MRRILIIKPQRIGDLLLLTPTLAALKSCDSRIRIDVLVCDHSAGILERFSKIINRVWTIIEGTEDRLSDDSTAIFDVPFDAVIELSGEPFGGYVLAHCRSERKFRSNLYGKHGSNHSKVKRCSKLASRPTWEAEHAMDKDRLVIQAALGVRIPRTNPIFPVRKTDFPVLIPTIREPFAVFQPTSRDPTRTWAEEEWRTLAKYLLRMRMVEEVIIPFGSHEEGKRAASIARGVTGCRLSPPGLSFHAHAALVQRAAVCVSCNTGPMHLAAAVNAPIVAVWGRMRIKKWYPLCDRFSIVCQNRIISAASVRRKKSPVQQGRIEANEVGTVARAVAEILGFRFPQLAA